MRLSRFLIVPVLLFLASCMVSRTAWYNYTDISNYKIFPSRALPASTAPFRFVDGQLHPGQALGGVSLQKIDSIARLDESVAVLIIRHDSLLFENYYLDYSAASKVPSFSMAKSYTSALIGVAIEDGYIKNINDRLIKYVPELDRSRGFEKVTLRHLLMMTSGIKSNGLININPRGLDARLYYGRHLYKYLMHLKVEGEPGKEFDYSSVNTQLLGLVLERVTGKTVTQYLNDRIWQSLGTEFDASWSIDKKNDGHEKTFCCINATARDYAKFGRLFLHRGNWNGAQLVPAAWVDESTASAAEGVFFYKYQWWITEYGYYASGYHGEYIYVNPTKGLIMIRLGEAETRSWPRIFEQISMLM